MLHAVAASANPSKRGALQELPSASTGASSFASAQRILATSSVAQELHKEEVGWQLHRHASPLGTQIIHKARASSGQHSSGTPHCAARVRVA